jgi:hypothetical protein
MNVTVMGADGSNPTVIFVGPKFKRGSTMPSWSPGGEWVAFWRPTQPEVNQVSGIYKIRPSGDELTQIMCAAGTGRDNVHFSSLGDPKWSPDGQWILLRLHYGEWVDADWLGIVRANEQPDGSCHSDLIHLYSPDGWDPQSATGWRIGGATSWNHDGSKIAFFEMYFEDDGDPTEFRLKVLEIDDLGDTPTVTATHPIALPEGLQQLMYETDLDWQRDGGSILLFGTYDGTDKISWLDLDLDNGEIREWGHLTDGWNANWSPDNDRIVYNVDVELKVADIGYNTERAPMLLASSVIYPGRHVCLWPDWKRDVLSTCGDGVCEGGENECTCSADCGFAPGTEIACTDGVDNDCDTYIDCDDSDCGSEPACLPPLCGDGLCNGSEDSCGCATDCGSPPTTELLCSDTLDNDCDLAFDCTDTDCFEDPSCVTVDCSQFGDKRTCNAEPSCRWDNRNKECVRR